MSLTAGQTSIFKGKFEKIPSTASPGLLWLKKYALMDDLSMQGVLKPSDLIRADVEYSSNGVKAGDPCKFFINIVLIEEPNNVRREVGYGHECRTVWDVALSDTRRTVILEGDNRGVELTAGFVTDQHTVPEVIVFELAKTDGKWKAWKITGYGPAADLRVMKHIQVPG
ncbi:hypothetical protein BGZ63DRAFT_377229 [Mariannaea sp. PMI_226]|nr:hypothetical protein BGZ63DRAFT_377229 [Mariannaea sp. PMI_226]